jgi:hypothetical protein
MLSRYVVRYSMLKSSMIHFHTTRYACNSSFGSLKLFGFFLCCVFISQTDGAYLQEGAMEIDMCESFHKSRVLHPYTVGLCAHQWLRCSIVYRHVCTVANREHLHWRASLCGGVISCCSENELGSRFEMFSTIYVNELCST